MNEAIVFGVLLVALVLFITGRIRYDIVAIGALLVLTALRIIPASVAFHGFGHPAVVTVGAVLILSKVLENSGVIDVMEGWYSRVGKRLTVQVFSLSGLVAVLSAFMNNVGALSLMMPLAIRVASSAKRPYSPYLMAPVLRFSAGRTYHSDRDPAQHHNLRFSAGSGWRIISHVRLYASRSGGCHLRTAVHLLRRLASHPFQATAGKLVRCNRHRGLHGGSARN